MRIETRDDALDGSFLESGVWQRYDVITTNPAQHFVQQLVPGSGSPRVVLAACATARGAAVRRASVARVSPSADGNADRDGQGSVRRDFMNSGDLGRLDRNVDVSRNELRKHLLEWNRPAERESLAVVDAERPGYGADSLAFDTLGNGLEFHGPAELDNGAQHGLGPLVPDDVPHEGPIDLQVRDG